MYTSVHVHRTARAEQRPRRAEPGQGELTMLSFVRSFEPRRTEDGALVSLADSSHCEKEISDHGSMDYVVVRG